MEVKVSAKDKWLLKILFERFGHSFTLHHLASDRVRLSLADSENFVDIRADEYTFSRCDSDLDCTSWDAGADGWKMILDIPLIAPGMKQIKSPLINKIESGYYIAYDILGLTYWMLSRLEEVGRKDLDEHGRFPAVSSHAYKYGYIERPIVDEWLDILGQVIKLTWPNKTLKVNQFQVKVSHDVDIPSRYTFCGFKKFIRSIASDLLKRGDWKSLFRAPWIRFNSKYKLHPSDPVNTFDWIMASSESNNLVSAFYFMCGRTEAAKDADYDLEHPAIRKLMKDIYNRGHEIGLHPSYNSYLNPEAIIDEATRLRLICKEEGIKQTFWGGRMHYLRWTRQTMGAWEQAALNYDSTLGYADHAGFRCGTCFEYQAFDPVEHRELDLRIRPLIVMECSVMDACYMGLGISEVALNKILEFKNTCRRVNGCFTLLWHNSELSNLKERFIYQSVLSG